MSPAAMADAFLMNATEQSPLEPRASAWAELARVNAANTKPTEIKLAIFILTP